VAAGRMSWQYPDIFRTGGFQTCRLSMILGNPDDGMSGVRSSVAHVGKDLIWSVLLGAAFQRIFSASVGELEGLRSRRYANVSDRDGAPQAKSLSTVYVHDSLMG